MAELRAGVAGAGSFGGHHARKYAGMAGVRLAAVFDVHAERAQTLAGPLGGVGVSDLDAFLAGVDLVTVATPAATHAAVALAALRAGKPVYVEKPLATDLTEAQRLVDAAAKAELVLAVGHQERAVLEALGLLPARERLIAIQAERRGAPLPRNRDVSCVLDLMIHDLDLALALSGGEAIAVEGEGSFDAVTAEVTFDTGLTAVLTAAREPEGRGRTLRLDYPGGRVAIDFLAARVDDEAGLGIDPARVGPAFADPLGASVARFVAAVRGEAAGPLVSGAEGLRALDLAFAVEQAVGL